MIERFRSNWLSSLYFNPISTGGGGGGGGWNPHPERFFQHYSETRKAFLFKLGNFFH